MSNIKMYSPKNREDLLRCLKEKTAKTMFIAGGTDIIVGINEGKYKPDAIIDISHLKEYKYINLNEDVMRIGALTTFSDIQYNSLIQKHMNALAVASSMVGSPQIRNAGTIGGNIANASAAADISTVMFALDASVNIMNSKGTIRSEKINDLIIRPNRTNLNVDEIIIGFEFECQKGIRSGFAKVGSRTGVTISKMNACLIIEEDSNRIKSIRIALGAVGLKPFRHLSAENELIDLLLDDNFKEKLQDQFVSAVDGSIKTRSSWPYKRVAIKGLALDVIKNYKKNTLI